MFQTSLSHLPRAILGAVLCGLPLTAQSLVETHRMLPGHLDQSDWGTTADLDGDGSLDLMITNGWTAQANRLYLNDGTGVLLDASAGLPSHVDDSRFVAFADVDGDGDLDAALASYGQERLYLNDGAAVFSDATMRIPSDSSASRSTSFLDVDGDGDLDLLIGNAGENEQNNLYLNDGTGFFSDATAQLPQLGDHTHGVAVGDVDSDGDPDAMIGNAAFQQNHLYINDGSGLFTDGTLLLPVDADHSNAIVLADVDGDGDLDSMHAGTGQNRLVLNDGSGVFSDAPGRLPVDSDDSRGLAIADVDGDGDLDALIGSGVLPQQDRLLLNDGAGSFVYAPQQQFLAPARESTLATILADMDGDGDVDAIAIAYSPRVESRYWLNDGDGTFAEVTRTQRAVLGATYGVSLADADGDGHLDVFLANGLGRSNLLLGNDGTGLLSLAATGLAVNGDDSRDVATGDLDGDGDLDAVFGNNGTRNRLQVGDGAGAFLDATSGLPIDADATLAVVLGDLDGDGDLDLVTANAGGVEQNRSYMNDGAGNFSDMTALLPVALDHSQAAELEDVDSDGDLDLFFGNGQVQQNTLYANDGSGTFQDMTARLPSFADHTHDAAFVDVDGDGDPDLIVANALGEVNRLYLNDGAGTFTDDPLGMPSFLEHTDSLATGDLDGDGSMDLLFGNLLGTPDRMLLNDGSGTFAERVGAVVAAMQTTSSLALGDLDSDGDLDVVMGEQGNNRVLFNTTRQLAWRGTPRTGNTLTMDLAGPANGAWILAVSSGTATIPFAPFGTLRLNPITVMDTGTLDTEGRAARGFFVPPDVQLIGATIYWQAAVGPTFRLTGLDVTRFTAL